jgi:FMN reductase
MTDFNVVGIAGNLQRPSKTSVLVGEVVRITRQLIGGQSQLFDIVDAGPDVGAYRSPAELAGGTAKIVRALERADVLVVGSPVYKGSYTGLLKHLFDLTSPQALAGKPVILTATGGSPLHGLIIEHQLRPLLSFFGAHTAPTAIYAIDSDFRDYRIVNPTVAERIERSAREVARLAAPATPAVSDDSDLHRQIAAG